MILRPRDWPAAAEITGYWFLEPAAEWKPPADLIAFLAAGDPPIAVGFGSMVVDDAGALGRELLSGIRAAGHRVVLVSGQSDFGREPGDDLYVVESVPSHWLFPRCAAVICHGGAGTVAAALRAGKPTIVMPVLADQSFWGERVAALGVGVRSTPPRKADHASIEAAVRRATRDARMVGAARGLGEAIRAEDGVQEAVSAIEEAADR